MLTGTRAQTPQAAKPVVSAAGRTGLSPGGRLALAAAAWLLGMAWQLQLPALWPMAVHQALVAGGGAVLLVGLVWRGARQAVWRGAWPAVALLMLALGSTGWRADLRLAERLPSHLEGQDLLVTGVVAAMPQAGPTGLRFVFEPERAMLRDQAVVLPGRLSLGWYKQFNDEAWLDDPREGLRAGQRWRLPLRLKQPHGALNPHGFDAELMWFEQGIGATGYVRVVRGWQGAELLTEAAAHPVERLRQAVRDALFRQVPDARLAGVLAALAVGDQSAIDGFGQ